MQYLKIAPEDNSNVVPLFYDVFVVLLVWL